MKWFVVGAIIFGTPVGVAYAGTDDGLSPAEDDTLKPQDGPPAPGPAFLPSPTTSPTPEKKRDETPAKVQGRGGDPDSIGEHLVTWDANLEGAYGRAFGENYARTMGFVRGRGGVLWIHGPWYSSAGAFYEWSNITPATFGVQIEQMHLSTGAWIQLGAGIDIEPRPMGTLSLGWSLFGVEAQYRTYGDAGEGAAVFGKLRIPIGVIAHALATQDKPTAVY